MEGETKVPGVDQKPDLQALKPFYEELIAEYFPETVRW